MSVLAPTSSVAIIAQDGSVFHATGPEVSANASPAMGRCSTAISLVRSSGTSAANPRAEVSWIDRVLGCRLPIRASRILTFDKHRIDDAVVRMHVGESLAFLGNQRCDVHEPDDI